MYSAVYKLSPTAVGLDQLYDGLRRFPSWTGLFDKPQRSRPSLIRNTAYDKVHCKWELEALLIMIASECELN